MKRHVTIFGTSLDPVSRSQILAREALARLQRRAISAKLVDLRELSLPESGRPGAYESQAARELRAEVGASSHLIFAVAIYNWDVSSSAKNLLELLTDNELNGKTVGFLCAAGGQRSYMSVMPFANSLMLDFRCWIAPRFVYAIGSDFTDGALTGEKVCERLDLLVEELFQRDGASAA
jgi:FMN reductase